MRPHRAGRLALVHAASRSIWNAPRPGFPNTATPEPLSTATQPTLLPDRGGGAFGSGQLSGASPPPDSPLVEKKFEELSNQNLSDDGKKAMAIEPERWKHAETNNFILHYRRVTEAQKVVREVEYDLWYVATQLGAKKERYSRKSHVYIFEDEDDWKQFMDVSSIKTKWAVSYAWGDELYLNVRGGGNTGSATSFDAKPSPTRRPTP